MNTVISTVLDLLKRIQNRIDVLQKINFAREIKPGIVGLPHFHSWVELPWNRQLLGPDITFYEGNTGIATFRDYFRCEWCGKEVVTSVNRLY